MNITEQINGIFLILYCIHFSQIMEDRCQKAIERQQVRSDYNELAEKLECLLQKYPENLPTSVSFSFRRAINYLRATDVH